MVNFLISLRNNGSKYTPNCTIFQIFLGGTCPRTPVPCTACSVAPCIDTLLETLSARLCIIL